MKKNLASFLFILSTCSLTITSKAQSISEYDQLVSVNKEWKNQGDADPQLKRTAARPVTEQQLVQFHLTQTEKLLRKRDVAKMSAALQQARARNLDVLHQYLTAGIFPINNKHIGRQPYFIDDYHTYCAVGYLMKESGADDLATDISRSQNYSYLADIHHEKLMSWVQQSGLSLDELALIQPSYGLWPSCVVELHYNNTGTDTNEYIEIHQTNGGAKGMLGFDTVRFYDGIGTLYKTLPITDMQAIFSDRFYYYVFPANESFADDGRVDISGTGTNGLPQLISTVTYTSSSVQVHDYHFMPGHPTDLTFNIGENESTPANSSLTYCGFYYNPGWSLQSMGATIGSLNACLTLPITLTDFFQNLAGKKVQLEWITEAEMNSKEFIVERSFDGIGFEAIGSVAAAGSSYATKHYSFKDDLPDYINYYRLKQVDIDGKFSYSKVLYVKVEQASPLRLLENIVTSYLRYRIAPGMNGSKIEIYDMNGRSVYKTKVKEGLQHVNVSAWSNGRYLIRLLADNGHVYSHQFIKQ
jgi:hypothetical protein